MWQLENKEGSEVKITQACLTLCLPMYYIIVHGILQARILEWIAFPFSRGSSQPRDQTQVSLSTGRFFNCLATREGQEYWSGYPIPSPVDLLNPGIKLGSPALQVNSLPTALSGKPKKAEHWRTDAFKLWFWKRLLRIPWKAKRSNQLILKESNPEYSFLELMLKLKL